MTTPDASQKHPTHMHAGFQNKEGHGVALKLCRYMIAVVLTQLVYFIARDTGLFM